VQTLINIRVRRVRCYPTSALEAAQVNFHVKWCEKTLLFDVW